MREMAFLVFSLGSSGIHSFGENTVAVGGIRWSMHWELLVADRIDLF